VSFGESTRETLHIAGPMQMQPAALLGIDHPNMQVEKRWGLA
jgi:hypothetical protein